VSLTVLVIPLGGIYIFRIYESELVKQTESELIAQAVLIAAVYKSEVEALSKLDEYGRRVAIASANDEYFRPVKPQLNLSRYRIRSRPADAAPTEQKADEIAKKVGAKLTPILLDAQRTNLSAVRLMDADGIVTAGRDDVGKSLAHVSEVRQALQGRYASAIRERTIHRPQPPLTSISRGTGVRVFIAYPITTGDRLLGAICLSRTPPSILEHLYSQKEKIGLVVAVILLLVILLVAVTSYSIARPLHALIDQTKRLAIGDKKALDPLRSPVTEEVALLSQSFSEMARSLEHRSEYIRDFAAQVSHEFKTPLTAIQGAVELLEDHANNMSADQRARFLRNIAQDSQRLKRLVERLLEMARADVLEPTVGKTPLAAMVDDLGKRYQDTGLILSLRGDRSATVRVVPEIMEMVFTNLLNNSRQNGAGKVEIVAEDKNDMISILLADDGEGISDANKAKIFTPFFTTHRDEGGTGLGLGIVRSMLKAYGGDIELEPSGKGAAFRVTAPRAE
jgi:signal transduction histidine kinase